MPVPTPVGTAWLLFTDPNGTCSLVIWTTPGVSRLATVMMASAAKPEVADGVLLPAATSVAVDTPDTDAVDAAALLVAPVDVDGAEDAPVVAVASLLEPVLLASGVVVTARVVVDAEPAALVPLHPASSNSEMSSPGLKRRSGCTSELRSR